MHKCTDVSWLQLPSTAFKIFTNHVLAYRIDQLQHDPDVGLPVRRAVTNWYRAIDQLSRDNWTLSEASSLRSIGLQFRTSFKHLVINGAEIYENDALSDKEKRIVDDFTKEIADIMIGLMREISVRAQKRHYN